MNPLITIICCVGGFAIGWAIAEYLKRQRKKKQSFYGQEKKASLEGQVTCKKDLFKSTYKTLAFINGKNYKIVEREKELIWVQDELERSFSFTTTDEFGMYKFAEYFDHEHKWELQYRTGNPIDGKSEVVKCSCNQWAVRHFGEAKYNLINKP